MRRNLADAQRWMVEGTAALLAAVDGLDDTLLDAPSVLPGWSRRMVVAHVASNADALSNLATWAATGVETPMYESSEHRWEGVVAGSALPTPDLREWLHVSADHLRSRLDALDPVSWSIEVRTAQGRTVPATEVPWMRDRELWVHLADIDAGPGLADAPAPFLVALLDDVVDKRRQADSHPAVVLKQHDGSQHWTIEGVGQPAVVTGALADLAAYATGRSRPSGAPALPPWL
jgi:maleylpyruvate isomerase